MNKSKYLLAALPFFIVVSIWLIAYMLDGSESCEISIKEKKPCIIYNIDLALSWFSAVFVFNFFFGWLFALWSLLKIGKLLGQDLPKPWGKKERR